MAGEAASRKMGGGKAEEELGHPAAQLSWDIRTTGDRRLDREGPFWERLGDTYLINWPRSSHRVSQPGHLHSPCP